MTFNALLNLQNPDLYNCRVRRYAQGHASLYLWVVNRDDANDKIFLIFSPTVYFSGQMRWQGADFVQASNDAMLKVARKVDHLNRYTDEELISHPKRLKLYEVLLSQDKIQILAGGVAQSYDLNIDFKG